ncbi:MAG: hypothetical protein ACP5RH_11940 [Leptodesmis sp.]|uniref:GFA family protein n=1 Tax=Leptodesmis sp. TaxID=3100501 RepID=UPI003D0DA2D3
MEGKCLCGAITVTTPDKPHIDACHCGMCWRWGGGPALGDYFVPAGLFQDGVEFEFTEQIFIDRKPPYRNGRA